jgi:hypothetical protein
VTPFGFCDFKQHTSNLATTATNLKEKQMLDNKNIGVAIRLYDNQKYGTTYGKGMYRTAIYNGTIDFKNSSTKYLVDFYTADHWMNTARTDAQMEILRSLGNPNNKQLHSWLYSYDDKTKRKTFVNGLCFFDLDTLEIKLLVADEATGIELDETLQAKPCKIRSGTAKSPQLLATNQDLATW